MQQRRLEQLWFGDLATLAIVTARVVRDGAPVGRLYREDADRERDSGWRVFAGDGAQEYLDEADNTVLTPLRELIGAEAALEPLFNHPPGSAFERVDGEFMPARE
ncbi:DUF2185 domain-containing protein [Nocardia arthritidis]|uniref:DUF2185 domain-containing protein n=1 Tax=Nocardia arthritidis TaxID=228602 RepID=UPI0007A47B96|nr:DUF2185 domain-containing protein [Nocardia arthritidis]